MKNQLKKFIINNDINYDKIICFLEDNDMSISQAKIFISNIINELKNDLIYLEVEDSYNGGETDYYNLYTSKIELLESMI